MSQWNNVQQIRVSYANHILALREKSHSYTKNRLEKKGFFLRIFLEML
jgi:hypothetical protein